MSFSTEVIDLANDDGECFTVTFGSTSGLEVIDLSSAPVHQGGPQMHWQAMGYKPSTSTECFSMVDLTEESESSEEISDIRCETMISEAKDNSERRQERPRGIECVVCLRFQNQLTSTKCGHVFCVNCVERLLQNNAKCPVCRERISKRQLRRIYC